MDKNQNLDVTSKDAGKDIVIRNGDAPKVYDPAKIALVGSIFSPSEFYSKRKTDYLKNEMHVVYDKNKGDITLVCAENSVFAKTVKGTLTQNKRLAELKINSEDTLTVKQIVKLLKFNKWLFKEESRCKEIIDILQKFEVTINTEIRKENDQRGNVRDEFVQKANHGKDLTFTGEASIFIGAESVTFKVEIVCEVRTKEVEFWMESVELKEIMDSQRDSIIQDEIEKFKEIVCIEQ